MNGVGSADPTNLDATFHRGYQPTDADGAAQFETVFPGHYQGRATHIHLMVHLDPEVRENNTIVNLDVAHVGQMYFDDDLIAEVEQFEPYTTNKMLLTPNANDFILAQEAAVTDPLSEYVLLGDSVEEGIFAWYSFGINTTLVRKVSAAATLYETGGESNPNAGGPGFGAPIGDLPDGFCIPAGGFPAPPGGDGQPGFPGGFQPPEGFEPPEGFPAIPVCEETGEPAEDEEPAEPEEPVEEEPEEPEEPSGDE